MRLVLNTNILISAFIRNSTNRKILFFGSFEYYVPEYAFSEIEKYRDMIISKSNLNEVDYELFLNLLKTKVNIASKDVTKSTFREAKRIMDNIDKDDTVFVALALALDCPIWSNDTDFKKQKNVKVYTTEDLMKLLEKS
jgi:predicted nucleic acid-binding protein